MILDEKRNVQIIEELEGKTIVNAEFIESETWATGKYIGLTFTDGRRLLILGSFPYNPDPNYEEMKDHPNFFSPDDMAEKVKRDEEKRIEWKNRKIEEERREYEKLKEKFGNE